MTLKQVEKALGLRFVGFWDRCFFLNIRANSGMIFEDENGVKIALNYLEIYKNMKGVKNETINSN